jgi:hypothetical protein
VMIAWRLNRMMDKLICWWFLAVFDRKTFHADIIFVHGLLGGAVRTWRQKDLPPTQDASKLPPRTDCWPKVGVVVAVTLCLTK